MRYLFAFLLVLVGMAILAGFLIVMVPMGGYFVAGTAGDDTATTLQKAAGIGVVVLIAAIWIGLGVICLWGAYRVLAAPRGEG